MWADKDQYNHIDCCQPHLYNLTSPTLSYLLRKMTNSTLKRKWDDQDDFEVTQSKSKRCKIEDQQELIRKIKIPSKKLELVNKKSLNRQSEYLGNILRFEEPKIKEIKPKSRIVCEIPVINKPTICMKCRSKFVSCSFTSVESEDHKDCCLQTIRSYLLQRRLSLARNPTFD